MSDTILFEEKQKFRQWWLWLIMVLALGDAIWLTIKGIQGHHSFDFTNVLLPWILLLIPLSGFIFIYSMTLITEIREDGIYIKFKPFHSKYRFYSWDEIEKIYVRQYKPISEYGGWGIKGFPGNKAYNISGYDGLQLVIKDNGKLLIGTQKPDVLNELLLKIPQAQHKNTI